MCKPPNTTTTLLTIWTVYWKVNNVVHKILRSLAAHTAAIKASCGANTAIRIWSSEYCQPSGHLFKHTISSISFMSSSGNTIFLLFLPTFGCPLIQDLSSLWQNYTKDLFDVSPQRGLCQWRWQSYREISSWLTCKSSLYLSGSFSIRALIWLL